MCMQIERKKDSVRRKEARTDMSADRREKKDGKESQRAPTKRKREREREKSQEGMKRGGVASTRDKLTTKK